MMLLLLLSGNCEASHQRCRLVENDENRMFNAGNSVEFVCISLFNSYSFLSEEN